jgi:hypothetical protein
VNQLKDLVSADYIDGTVSREEEEYSVVWSHIVYKGVEVTLEICFSYIEKESHRKPGLKKHRA